MALHHALILNETLHASLTHFFFLSVITQHIYKYFNQRVSAENERDEFVCRESQFDPSKIVSRQVKSVYRMIH